ncbi:MAG: biotin--[acetyl-CoA-carboxylase] ligase [Halobacteriota archaeon]|nr:biotin--[acetyl-CoA-carboxylase] ligase [Halobacteriota archaeon]
MSEEAHNSPFTGEVKDGLKTTVLGSSLLFYESVDSTSRVARELAKEGAIEGTVVFADEQTEGRGREGRSWFSSPGSVQLSIILRPDTSPSKVHMVTLMTGVAVAKTIRHYGIDARIKWPNDITIGGKKVCGILSEMGVLRDSLDYIILGIGVNVNVDMGSYLKELKETATSLKAELGRDIPRIEFIQSLLWELEYQYKLFERHDLTTISNEWKALSDTLGSWVKITTQKEMLEGEAIEINRDGGLVVKLKDGSLRTIFTGDCTHCRGIGIEDGESDR